MSFLRYRQHALLGSDGQALVEVALALPLIVFLLIGGGDLARAYAAQQAVQNGARAGAEAYAISVGTTPLTAPQVQSRVQEEIGSTPGVSASAAATTVGTTSIGGANYVQVRVQYTFRTVVPWPLVPNTANIDRTATFRIYP